jgi:glycosyltransferase involved in cell wall biosynthesis
MTGRHNLMQRNRLNRRLLLVSHRPIEQAGGPAARWRSFARHLPDHGWEVDVVSAGARTDEYAAPTSAQARARIMETAGRIVDPAFRLVGLRPEAVPLSTLWVPRAGRAVRAKLEGGGYDAVLATGPPFAALLAAARAADPVPLVVELRDLWAGNPAFDRGGPVLRKLENRVVDRASAVVAVTPEAADDLRRRHPGVRVGEIPNGFEPELLGQRRATNGTTILHSGTLTKDRPLAPLLRLLRPPLRLVLHGYVAPEIQAEVERSGVAVEIVPPSGWEDAVQRSSDADVALVTQGRGAGDETAVAAKVYEYLALGKPVLCLSHGGATEALLRRLDADGLCARLDDEASIVSALERIRKGELPEPVPEERLEPYERPRLAERLAQLLDGLVAKRTGEHVDDPL